MSLSINNFNPHISLPQTLYQNSDTPSNPPSTQSTISTSKDPLDNVPNSLGMTGATKRLYTILALDTPAFTGLPGPVTVGDVQNCLSDGAIPNQEHLRMILRGYHVANTPNQAAILQLLLQYGARPTENTFERFFAGKNNADLLDLLLMPNGVKLNLELSSETLNNALTFDYPKETIQKLLDYGVRPNEISVVYAKTEEMKAFIGRLPGTSYDPPTPIFDCLSNMIVWIVDRIAAFYAFIKSLFCCNC